MKSKKIVLPDGAIEFLSDRIRKDIPIEQAISEWNKKQESDKFLKIGDIVKIHRLMKKDPFHGKRGFIATVLSPVGNYHDPERSGKFSVFIMEHSNNSISGSFLGSELEPTKETISKEFVENYLKTPTLNDTMREELKQLMQEL
ncbi:hypothetical protein [Candidatus Nitrosotenuis cloacae]|uniref:Uncharacterized protein n=1 Tax=Candidatus Nitrosotenuis cloacae TaxID=1603555 RepID=A0A3G1B0Q3_9ARCH|nr:hypothetical protein [Candidatus Nitrosotenuis cloacae]AJZ75425.1 hypothetical protein SU86_002395 [Candidatus Nitrosotenuis cloacae]